MDLHKSIRAMSRAVKPALTVVDGITGMDGLGAPTMGRSRRANLVVAGQDLQAVDVTCCDLISVPIERVLHLTPCPRRTVGCNVEEVRVKFVLSTEMEKFGVRVHYDMTACSRCGDSLVEGRSALVRSPGDMLRCIWNCVLHRTEMIVGTVSEMPSTARGRLICYGDCTRRIAEKQGLQWVPGCPPSVSQQLKMY